MESKRGGRYVQGLLHYHQELVQLLLLRRLMQRLAVLPSQALRLSPLAAFC